MSSAERSKGSESAEASENAPSKAAARVDRRFLPQASASPKLLYGLFAASGLALGVGVYAQYIRPDVLERAADAWAFWPLAFGALCMGAGLWFSGSGDPALRVGAPGIAEERNGLQRIPWRHLQSVRYLRERGKVEVKGRDESGAEATFLISPRSQRAALARLLHEAAQRELGEIDVPESLRDELGPALEHDGTRIREPLQVVGKRCELSDKSIAFDRDARVCPRCERIYHYRWVPNECACGQSLQAQQDRMLDDDHAAVAKRLKQAPRDR